MATAPTLYWYQLDTGTLAATYFGQLNQTVADLCSENAVTAPTAPWQNSIGGTLFSSWQTQVDTAVRSLCTALSVSEPIALVPGSMAGQYQSEYAESLDGVVRALCSAYHADAVHFDGGAFLSIASLTSTDNDKWSFAFWAKPATSVVAQMPWWATDPTVNLFNGLLQQVAVADQPKYSFFGASVDFNSDVGALGANNSVPFGTWHCLIGSMDATTGDIKVYRGDTDITAGVFSDALPFVFPSNGLPMFICSDNVNHMTADIANMWIAPGQTLLTGGDIVEATRRKFIDALGKPVDLGADGSTPTGVAPRVYFSGDATAFPTNRGTGGAFTLTGSLTNASTSPSD